MCVLLSLKHRQQCFRVTWMHASRHSTFDVTTVLAGSLGTCHNWAAMSGSGDGGSLRCEDGDFSHQAMPLAARVSSSIYHLQSCWPRTTRSFCSKTTICACLWKNALRPRLSRMAFVLYSTREK